MDNSDLINDIADEQIIRASGLLSLLMPQASGVGIGVKGLDGLYQLVNKAMESLFGKTEGQITGATDADLFPPDIAARLDQADQQIIDGAGAVRLEVDFSVNDVALRCLWLKFPVLGSDGKVLSIGAVVIDVSRQESVAELRRSLEKLQETNQELQKAMQLLDRLASTDKLTGTWNRRRLEDSVINEMDRLKRYDHPVSLLVIDIDFFKKVNDLHGHGVGDNVLAELANVVNSTLRATDSLTRWGGEEFIVLCPNTTLSTVSMLAERLREKIARTPFPGVGQITVSVGVAELISGETWEQWFQRADAALYRAKACGRDQVQVAPETPRRAGMGENVSANFLQLSWHTAYECGNQLIDDQHRTLFGDANKLLAAILSGLPKDEVACLIDVLVGDVVQHFKDEEAAIAAAGFPGTADHAVIHRDLVDQAVILVNRFNDDTLIIGELVQFLAHDVIARHMLGADREFFPYLGG